MTVLTRIDEYGCGCDAAEHLAGLITIDVAVARIIESVRQVLETEEVMLAAARGRILANSIRARSAIPPFDNSTIRQFGNGWLCD